MDLNGEYTIPASREKVWDALNDPEILKQCIAGCEELIKESDTVLTAKVTAKVGPVRAKFSGKVTLSDIDAPNGYRISGEGQGGAAGFAKGGADVTLSDAEGGGTVLSYAANAEVGGKLASVGSRLVQGVAKKQADDFFGKFSEIVGGGAETAAEAPQESAPSAPEPATPAGAPSTGGGLPTWVWAGGIIVVAVVLFLAFSG
ncbi:MAG: carbon monoxide dehydrogenase subunit G [Proteobacteria bacterium]|nr:carbon monoxide dehydrogenase subunit G [Pseudomonadota bacterium]